MKLIKTLLTTTALVVAVSASADTKHFEGTFVGGQIGTSKGASKKADAFAHSTGVAIPATNAKKSSKFGVNGGVLVGHRAAVAQDVILGVSLGVDLESTKATAQQTVATGTAKSKVQRQYIVNLLGQAGYTVSKDVLVFANAGLSFAKFKFSGSYKGANIGGTNKNKLGWAIGAGAAYAINDTVSADLSYLYTAYNLKATKGLTSSATSETATVSAPKAYHTVTVGVKVKV
jgi:opacity protein-like surface antigen